MAPDFTVDLPEQDPDEDDDSDGGDDTDGGGDDEVMSNEMIKPLSSTPAHLRRYKLSLLDQLCPKAYLSFIYFYETNNNTSTESNIADDISNKLKKSLSQVLTLYYPLAGTFTDENYVNCNDNGVLFVEARALKSQLTDDLKNKPSTTPCELNEFLPFQLDQLTELPLGIQLNIFESGGVAIGVCLSHRLVDDLSSLFFIKNWMAIARGDEGAVVRPELVSAASLIPPKDMASYDPSQVVQKSNTVITKRFVFNACKVEALRAKYEEKTNQENSPKWRLSTMEALSAFIWSRFVAATKIVPEPAFNIRTIHHTVNLRPMFDPPLPPHSFGNFYTSSVTIPPLSSSSSSKEEDCNYGLARAIGEDIRKINKEDVENLRSVGDEFMDSLKKGTEIFVKGDMVSLVFTSVCGFPAYEADFGLGKPTWVSSGARCFKNVIAFLDNIMGDGVLEAYICFKPKDMAKFEVDKEFLALVISPTDAST
ncbi:stemmadenine O-acetyltransferase-like [Humulus lupulus]|uniref:stemmadenine O-acetyltransferase-like n=1 Tax=Humulus lupulus TaxID=3486 RepID=UPI002B40A462|nr:stemmadenine O-acetyltransferase-like [Humulus lupulus]